MRCDDIYIYLYICERGGHWQSEQVPAYILDADAAAVVVVDLFIPSSLCDRVR